MSAADDPRRVDAPPREDGLVLGEGGRARPAWASVDPLLRDYYDTEWGMPVRDERGIVFAREVDD